MELPLEALQAIGLRLLGLIFLIALDTIGGVVLALKAGDFQWKKLGNFVGKHATKLVGLLIFEALALLPMELRFLAQITDGLAYTVYVTLLVSTAATVMAKAKFLSGESN